MSQIIENEDQSVKLIFEKEEILNYYLSLKTKPFVILMGLSGSGKSELAIRFAEAMTERDKLKYALVPVEAGWIDNKSLLGYYNPITQTYSCTDFLKILLRAYNNYTDSIIRNKREEICPYFIILDEMNLSKVEYYFSKFLSVLETKKSIPLSKLIDELGRKVDKKRLNETMILTEPISLHHEISWVGTDIKGASLSKDVSRPENVDAITPGLKVRDLHGSIWEITEEDIRIMKEFESVSGEKQKHAIWKGKITGTFIRWIYDNKRLFYEKKERNIQLFIPPQIRVPPNIYFTGTVNIDETTYMFSPKVLDRANSIELINIDIDSFEKMLFQEKSDSKENSDAIEIQDVIKQFTNNYEFKFNLENIKTNSSSIKSNLTLFDKWVKKFFEKIKILSKVFEESPKFKFGYRVIHEMFKYLVYAFDLLGVSEGVYDFAFDIQLKQKILPKIHGMKSELKELLDLLSSTDYSRFSIFQKKVSAMKKELIKKQFTSYM